LRLLERFKNWIRGGAMVGNTEELKSILDHPKIDMNKKEHDRIQQSLKLYRGRHAKVVYFNSKRQRRERDRKTINMTKKVANKLASVTFNEKCKIDISNDVAAGFMAQVFEQNDFYKTFRKYLEPMFALGGLAVRPYVDVADGYKIKFSWALADSFFPLASTTGEIKGCAIPFRSSKMEGKTRIFYTLLEIHEWVDNKVQITNELYRSDKENVIGKRVPLSYIREDLSETATVNVSAPLFNYLKPAEFNNINPDSPLGVGVADNAWDTLEQINETYDQFFWEVKMGRRKIAVSDKMMKVTLDNDGRPVQAFDDDTDLFIALKGEMDETLLKDLTSDIRAEQYIATINKFFAILEMETGLSSGTFKMDDNGVVKTATEVVSEDSETFRTRADQLINVEDFLKGLIISTLELAAATTGPDSKQLFTGNIPTYSEIDINFDDGVFTDKTTKLEHYSKMVDAGLMPRNIAIQRVAEVTEDTAREWQLMMRREQIQFNPEYRQSIIPTALFGREQVRAIDEELGDE